MARKPKPVTEALASLDATGEAVLPAAPEVAAAILADSAEASAEPEARDFESLADDEAELIADEAAARLAFSSLASIAAAAVPAAPAKVAANRAEAVAKTWTDPAVRAKRAIRNAVRARELPDGVFAEYASTRKAFRALRLPDSKHIPFRIGLKEKTIAVFEFGGRKVEFEVIPASE